MSFACVRVCGAWVSPPACLVGSIYIRCLIGGRAAVDHITYGKIEIINRGDAVAACGCGGAGVVVAAAAAAALNGGGC